MKYVKDNKELLIKYLFIIINNILIHVICSFYFKTSMYKDIVILLIVVIVDMIIYYYKGTKKFIYYLDILTNFIIGLILMLFIKDSLSYSNALFSLFFANNIIFMRSRFSDKFLKKTLQYLMIFIYTILTIFVNLLIYNIIF